MNPSDEDRLVAAFSGHGAGASPDRTLCDLCVDTISASGVALSLDAGGNTSRLCASDDRTAHLEDLQFTLGEGPSFEARSHRVPVTARDLGSAHDRRRWPAFAGPAARAGIRAIVARPLRLGGTTLGVVTMYDEEAGPPTAEAAWEAALATRLLARRIVDLQNGLGSGELALELADAGDYRAEVHQASGMVSVQLGVDVHEALIRIRAHAFSTGVSTSSVATDIVARRLRLDP